MKQKSFLKKLYEIFTPRERMQAMLIFFASLFAAFAQAFGVASIFPFINVVVNPGIIEQNKFLLYLYERGHFTDANSFSFLLGIIVFFIIVLSGSISVATSWAKTKFALGKNHSLSRRLLTVYLYQPYEFFLQKNSSELGTNILSEINQLTSQLLMSIFDIIINGLMAIVMLGMLFMVNIFVTTVTIIFLGCSYGLINYLIKNKLHKKGKKRFEANRGRFRMANEALSGIKTTKVMGIEQYFLKKFNNFSLKYARYNVFAHMVGEIPKYILETSSFGGIVFFILFMISRGDKVMDFIPLLSLYAFAAYRTIPAFNRLFNAMTKVHYNSTIVDKIYIDMVELASEMKAVSKNNIVTDKFVFNEKIELQNLKFSYKDSPNDVINNISLIIHKNNIIGFAGATGCGKTTLVDMILGLLIPHEGKILIDNVELNEENISNWQRKIGYVPQEIFLSDDTILKNIAFGVPDDSIDIKQVKYAAKIAALENFIEDKLPQKFNTLIGERGIRLSGGERQRIGLARALYRNPEVLILDEATSSLDGATEEIVLKAIQDAAKSRTVIMIAHRLNTLKDCDQIYIMERGKIIGQGKYDKLISKNKKFREMAKLIND